MRFEKLAANYGCKSFPHVYECSLKPSEFENLKTKLKSLDLGKGDSIALYPVCQHCRESRIFYGKLPELMEEDINWLII